MPLADVEKIVRKVPLDEFYDVGNELGRGKFAIVKRCTEKCSGKSFACKVLKKRRRGKSCRDEILVEIDIMRQAMDHGQIVKLHEVFESSHEIFIIIELATGGELFRVIAIDPLPEEKAREVVYQILDGVRHLHTLNIVHLDLKPENILLYRKGSLDVKIADFGLAVQLREGEKLRTLVGTAEYVAPEILNFEPLSTFSDMWSIGALTYALLTGYSPFQGETHQETFLNVSTCDYDFDDEVFEMVSLEAKEFIEKLLIKHPTKRMSADKSLQHTWMASRNKANNLNSSTSSLDSALCLDSASSMEPSPVSSASSSFSPAPSATSRNTSSGQTSTSASAAAVSYSQPADIGKVNEKLSQISTLATERLVAENASRPRPEGSPASDSSTGTLKGDESAESTCIPVLVKEPSVVDIGKGVRGVGDRDRSVLDGIETIDGRKPKVSETESKGNDERKRKTSDTESSGALGRKGSLQQRLRTLDRGFSTNELSPPSAEKATVNSQRSSTLTRSTSNQPASRDLTLLNPKTLESLEKYKKLKEVRARPKTPEPVSMDVSETKLQMSPERIHRRKSVGMHPIERHVDVKRFKAVEPTVQEEHHSTAEDEEHIKEEKVTRWARGSPSPTKMSTSPSATRRMLTPSPTKMTSSPRPTSRTSPSPTKLGREVDGVWRQPKADYSVGLGSGRSRVSSNGELSPELPSKRGSPPLYPDDRPSSSGSSTTSAEVARITEGAERKERNRDSNGLAKPTSGRDTTSPREGRRSREGRAKEEENDRLYVSTPTRTRSPDLRREAPKAGSRSPEANKTLPTHHEIPLRQKSPIPERLKVVKADRRKTPVISMDALNAIMCGEIPDDELEEFGDDYEGAVLGEKFINQRKAALEACVEEDESQKSPERTRRHAHQPDSTNPRVTSPIIRNSSRSGLQTVVLGSSGPNRPHSRETRVDSKAPRDRAFTESLPVYNASERRTEASVRVHSTSGLSPNKTLSPPTSPELDPFSCSMDSRAMLSPSRLRVQSMSLSRSTPDLTEIGEKDISEASKQSKRVERSNSRRLKNRFTRLGGGDSYITDTSVHHASHTSPLYRGSRGALPTKLLGGSPNRQTFSPFSRKHRERDSNRSHRLKGSNTDAY